MGLQTLENKALSRGIIGKSAPILAEITIRKSQDFKFLRDFATQKALLQRKARDLVQQYLQKREYLTRSRAFVLPAPRPIDMMRDRARQIKQPRLASIPCPTSGIGHAMVKLPNGNYWCRECERVHEQSLELSL